MTVGAQQMDFVVPQQLQRKVFCASVGEEASACLNQYGQLCQGFRDSLCMEGTDVPVNMRHNRNKVALVPDLCQFLHQTI